MRLGSWHQVPGLLGTRDLGIEHWPWGPEACFPVLAVLLQLSLSVLLCKMGLRPSPSVRSRQTLFLCPPHGHPTSAEHLDTSLHFSPATSWFSQALGKRPPDAPGTVAECLGFGSLNPGGVPWRRSAQEEWVWIDGWPVSDGRGLVLIAERLPHFRQPRQQTGSSGPAQRLSIRRFWEEATGSPVLGLWSPSPPHKATLVQSPGPVCTGQGATWGPLSTEALEPLEGLDPAMWAVRGWHVRQ